MDLKALLDRLTHNNGERPTPPAENGSSQSEAAKQIIRDAYKGPEEGQIPTPTSATGENQG